MALFKSQVLTQASGSVGGVVYSHARGGMYMRARAMPVNPNTTFQSQVRAGLTDAVNRWTSVLTALERAAWELYAANVATTNRLGDPIFLSGQNMYIRSRTVQQQLINKLSVADNFTSVAPSTFNLGDFTTPTGVTVSVASGITGTLNAGDQWLNEDDSIMLMFQGRPMNAARNYFRGPWRLVGFAAGDSVTPPTTITATAANIGARGFAFVAAQKVNVVFAVLRADNRLSTRRNAGNFIATG